MSALASADPRDFADELVDRARRAGATAAQARVDPTTSENRNVTVPVGITCPSATRREATDAGAPTARPHDHTTTMTTMTTITTITTR